MKVILRESFHHETNHDACSETHWMRITAKHFLRHKLWLAENENDRVREGWDWTAGIAEQQIIAKWSYECVTLSPHLSSTWLAWPISKVSLSHHVLSAVTSWANRKQNENKSIQFLPIDLMVSIIIIFIFNITVTWERNEIELSFIDLWFDSETCSHHLYALYKKWHDSCSTYWSARLALHFHKHLTPSMRKHCCRLNLGWEAGKGKRKGQKFKKK